MHLKETKTVFGIASIMAVRLLGFFMILPVFSVEAMPYKHATVLLIGLALGIYGLTQGCLQLPFGWLSDRVGRKPIIYMGLCLFIAGSILCAISDSIITLIIGRALQGAGAIGSSLLALVADVTQDEHRGQAMAIIGFTIGFSFSLSLVLGPLFNKFFGLNGIFWISALMGVAAILVLYFFIPSTAQVPRSNILTPTAQLKAILLQPELCRLDFGIFVLHANFTALFIAIPILMTKSFTLNHNQQALIYLAALFFSYLGAVPFIILGEKKRMLKKVFLGAIAILSLSQVGLLIAYHSVVAVIALVLLFFMAFTVLEATLPSLVSKISPLQNKGAAMGIYSTSQFLGIFVGGLIGGFLFQHFGFVSLILFSCLLPITWLFIAYSMQEPPYLSTICMKISSTEVNSPTPFLQQVEKIFGIAEAIYCPNQELLYLKYDRKLIEENELRKLLRAGKLA